MKFKNGEINVITGKNDSGKTSTLNNLNNNPDDFFDVKIDQKYFFSINDKEIKDENVIGGSVVTGTKSALSNIQKIRVDGYESNYLHLQSISEYEVNIGKNDVIKDKVSTGLNKYFYLNYILFVALNRSIKQVTSFMKNFYNKHLSLSDNELYDENFHRYINNISKFMNIKLDNYYLSDKLDNYYLSDKLDIFDLIENSLENIDELIEGEETDEALSFNLKYINEIQNRHKANVKISCLEKFVIKHLDITDHSFYNYLRYTFKSDEAFDLREYVEYKFELTKLKLENIDFIEYKNIINELKKAKSSMFISESDLPSFNSLIIIDEIENSIDFLTFQKLTRIIKSIVQLNGIVNVTFVIATHSIDLVKMLAHFNKSNFFHVKNNSNKKIEINEIALIEQDYDFTKLIMQGQNPEVFFNDNLIILEGPTDLYFMNFLRFNNIIDFDEFDGYSFIQSSGISSMPSIAKFLEKNSFLHNNIIFIIDEDINPKFTEVKNDDNEYKDYPYSNQFNREFEKYKILNDSLISLYKLSNKNGWKILSHLYKGIENVYIDFLMNDENKRDDNWMKEFDKYKLFDFNWMNEKIKENVRKINIKKIFFEKTSYSNIDEDKLKIIDFKNKFKDGKDVIYTYKIYETKDGFNKVIGPLKKM